MSMQNLFVKKKIEVNITPEQWGVKKSDTAECLNLCFQTHFNMGKDSAEVQNKMFELIEAFKKFEEYNQQVYMTLDRLIEECYE